MILRVYVIYIYIYMYIYIYIYTHTYLRDAAGHEDLQPGRGDVQEAQLRARDGLRVRRQRTPPPPLGLPLLHCLPRMASLYLY